MFEFEPQPPNSVLKLFHDLYADLTTADLLYTNDAKVLMDIIVGRLSNLSPGDEVRVCVCVCESVLVCVLDSVCVCMYVCILWRCACERLGGGVCIIVVSSLGSMLS